MARRWSTTWRFSKSRSRGESSASGSGSDIQNPLDWALQPPEWHVDDIYIYILWINILLLSKVHPSWLTKWPTSLHMLSEKKLSYVNLPWMFFSTNRIIWNVCSNKKILGWTTCFNNHWFLLIRRFLNPDFWGWYLWGALADLETKLTQLPIYQQITNNGPLVPNTVYRELEDEGMISPSTPYQKLT